MFPARRPPLGLGFASASAGVLRPGPSAVHAPFLFFPATRWAKARPLLCSASQRSGRVEVGREGRAGGGGAAGHGALELARKGFEKLQKLASSTSWESHAQLRGSGGGRDPPPSGLHSTPQVRGHSAGSADSRSARSLEMSASASSRARARGPSAGERSRDPPSEPKTSVFIFKQTDQLHQAGRGSIQSAGARPRRCFA